MAQLWQEMYTWPLVHWAMIEAIVAAVCFVVPRNSCGIFSGVEEAINGRNHGEGCQMRRTCPRSRIRTRTSSIQEPSNSTSLGRCSSQ